MSLVSTIRRKVSRVSLEWLLTASTFVFVLSLSALFLAISMRASLAPQKTQADAFHGLLAERLATFILDGTPDQAEALLADLAPGAAQLILPDGTRLGQDITANAGQPSSYTPLGTGPIPLGLLHTVPLVPYRLSPSPPIAALIALSFASLAALIAFGFACRLSRYFRDMTATIQTFISPETQRPSAGSPVTAELRRFRLTVLQTQRALIRKTRQLQQAAEIDSRTGLLNERSLQARIEQALVRARFDAPAALILLKIGGYDGKIGRAREDLMVKHISKVLKQTAMKSESSRGLPPGHWALASPTSNRFALLVSDFGYRDDLASLVRELQAAFRTPVKLGDQAIQLALEGSIVLIPEDGDTVSQIQHRAEDTLRDLRVQNKSGFGFYSPKLERQRDAMRKLEAELNAAIEQDLFIPLFQPKIDLSTGRITGVEALARWQLKTGRLVSPSVFIELAEETGQIGAIGEQILRKACIEAAGWARAGHPLSLAVNVSPQQFEDESLTQTILDAVAKSGLPPRWLQIEITESLAIAHPDRVKTVLAPLRKLGMQLAIDDFGTGHSNLATLTRLDFDVFKIDRQFVSGTPNDPQANAIVDMILSMAHTLNMQIVGEGIETGEQAAFLAGRGCHVGQGYLYSPPISAEAFGKMLTEQPFMAQRKRA